MTAADMKVKSEAIRTQITDDIRYVLHLKEVAKKKKDVIKLTCVNDRLVQLKAQQNIADGVGGELQGALERNSDERFNLYVQLDSTASEIKTLREQAAACIGEPELFKQESGVIVEKPEITDDPTVDPFGPEVEPPGYASPFD